MAAVVPPVLSNHPAGAENQTEMTLVRLLSVGAALLLSAGSMSAQTLGDMAKRAQEQRNAAAGKSRLELESPAELRTLPLDRPEVEPYVHVRVALARLWHLDPALFQPGAIRSGSV
jgi:hypothetical protein